MILYANLTENQNFKRTVPLRFSFPGFFGNLKSTVSWVEAALPAATGYERGLHQGRPAV